MCGGYIEFKTNKKETQKEGQLLWNLNGVREASFYSTVPYKLMRSLMFYCLHSCFCLCRLLCHCAVRSFFTISHPLFFFFFFPFDIFCFISTSCYLLPSPLSICTFPGSVCFKRKLNIIVLNNGGKRERNQNSPFFFFFFLHSCV